MRFGNGLRLPTDGLLAAGQGIMLDGVGILNHELEHEATHLAALAAIGGIIVKNSDIRSTLQQTVEIVGIDANLVFDRGKFVGMTDAVGNERTVVDATRQHALAARKQQHVVEVQVTRFEHAHHLQALGGLTVEGNRRLLNQLADKPLQGVHGDVEHTVGHEAVQTVDERIGPEQRLLKQRVGLVAGVL